MEPAVFLDRDGVLNRSMIRDRRPYAPTCMEEFVLLPGVVEGTQLLKKKGFLLIVVTNQPDVGKGTIRREVVEEMHKKLQELLPVDEIKACYHVDSDQCECRKPKPGMLIDAASKWSIDLSHSFMVGDRWRDISAGKAAGCKTILIRSDYQETHVDEPEFVASSLLEASQIILQQVLNK